MSATHDDAPGIPARPQARARKLLLAVLLGVLPLYTSLIIYEVRRSQPISVQGFTLYLAVISPLAIVIALLLLRFLCGEKPRGLDLKRGRMVSDLLHALVLSVLIVVASVIAHRLLAALLPNPASDASVRNLFAVVARDPGRLILFAGPLLLLGAASEEVIRVFFLSRLWTIWPAASARLAVVVVSAGLFGLIHAYQGPVHVGWAAIFGLIMGFDYLRFGRVGPLILAHYVTNALQLIVVALAAR